MEANDQHESENTTIVPDARTAIIEAVEKARNTNPLAGAITNSITMDFVANAQLAVGGSAAIVFMAEEGEALVEAGGAVYLNIGGLLPIHAESVPATAKRAHELGKPWVLDPVGIGIGSQYTNMLCQLKASKPTIVRGNASEIIALAGLWELIGDKDQMKRVRGVDTTDPVFEALPAAIAIAQYTGGAVAISGKDDVITDGHLVAQSAGGSSLMSKVTGFGCSLGGVMAVYAAVTEPFIAALTAVAHYNAAGVKADTLAQGPASFKVAFIDNLYSLTPEEIAHNPLVIEEV